MQFKARNFVRQPKHYPRYLNSTRPYRQSNVQQCDPDCDCNSPACPCFGNKKLCALSCECQHCSHRYPPCQCSGSCRSASLCSCLLLLRDCGEDCVCNDNDCHNRLFLPASLDVKPSPIAGYGLFPIHDIPPKTYLGDYVGPLVADVDPQDDHQVCRFRFSKGRHRPACPIDAN